MLTFKVLICPSSDGLIKAVGPAEIISAQYSEASFDKVIDATGMCILPGEYQLLVSGFLNTSVAGANIRSVIKNIFRIGGCPHSSSLGR